MREIEEQLAKEWAKMLAEHPEQAEHFARVLQGEKTPVREEKPRERRVTQEPKKEPLKCEPGAHSRGCESVLSYFRGVAKEKGWNDGESRN